MIPDLAGLLCVLSIISRVWAIMFEFEACEVFEIKELTFVNDCFKHKHNEEIGHYRRTLFIRLPSYSHLWCRNEEFLFQTDRIA